MQRYLERPWGRMAYRDAGGDGRAVVFVPGTFCDTSDWAAVLPLLGAGLRPIRVDLPAHGESAVPAAGVGLDVLVADVQALIAELALSRVVLVGHSLGGIVATAVAARCEQVTALVLLEAWTSRDCASAFGAAHDYAGLVPDTLAAVQARDVAVRARLPEAAWQVLIDTTGARDGWADLAALAIPVAQVWGDADARADAETRLRIPGNPCIETVWIPGAGHYLPLAAPAAVAAVIDRYARS